MSLLQLYRVMKLPFALSVLALFILISFGCGGGGGGGTSNSPGTSSLSLTPGSKQTVVAPSSADATGGVNWSVQEGAAGGTITSDGTYTAPATLGTYHIIGTSKSNSSTTIIIIIVYVIAEPTNGITLTPPSASLVPDASQTFTASGSVLHNQGVTWSVQEGAAGGTITSAGVYTAPATAGTYHVVATSIFNPSKTATATITVHIAVTVVPNTATLNIGVSKTFSASVAGTTNQNVTWSIVEGANGGTIDQTGFYTAPLQPGTYHVIATSQADTSQSGTATITVPSGSATGTIN